MGMGITTWLIMVRAWEWNKVAGMGISHISCV